MTDSILPVGARAYVDGRAVVTIAQVFPEGSTSLRRPHYCVCFDGGDGGQVKVSMRRVGVFKLGFRPRTVVLWSGGLDSTTLLHELAIKSHKNAIVALTIADHMGAQRARFARQARARRNYLKFAKGQGLAISYQEIQVTGSAMMESTGYVDDYVDKTRECSVLREWQVFMAWVLPFLREGDQVYLGYERFIIHQKHEKIASLLKTYAKVVGWVSPPTMHIILRKYPARVYNIPRNCVSSCDEPSTSRDCGQCGKCDRVREAFGYI